MPVHCPPSPETTRFVLAVLISALLIAAVAVATARGWLGASQDARTASPPRLPPAAGFQNGTTVPRPPPPAIVPAAARQTLPPTTTPTQAPPTMVPATSGPVP